MTIDYPKYGEFATTCAELCCAAGLLDLYCSSGDLGRPSSQYYFTKSCSVGTKDFPNNGHELDTVWGYPYGGERPRRLIELSKAAWLDHMVYQFESSLGVTYNMSWLRHFQDVPIVPMSLQIPSKETAPFIAVSGQAFLGSDLRAETSGWAVTHTGAFEARSDKDQVTASFDLDYLPLVYLVSTEDESLATIETTLTDGAVSGRVQVTEDFEAAAIVFRFQDKANHLRALVQKSPPLFAVQSVVAGVVTTIDSLPIGDDRVFTPGRYDPELIANTLNLEIINQPAFAVRVTLNGAAITAHLDAFINHINNTDNEDVALTISTTSSDFTEATRLGIYAKNAEVAFINCNITQTPSRKWYVSVYDDGEPIQLAEFDVTSDVTAPTGLLDFQRAGGLFAGQSSAIFVYAPVDEENPGNSLTGNIINQSDFLASAFPDVDDILRVLPVNEIKKELDSSWSITTRKSSAPLITYDKDDAATEQFTAYEMELGYKALPTFAQHSYPLAAGWRMTNVSFNETTGDPDPSNWRYEITVDHEIIAGPVVWSADGLTLPYVDDAAPVILYTFTETTSDVNLGDFASPTEDWVRRNISLISNPNVLGSAWTLPLKTFEADPDLTACVMGWGVEFYLRLGSKFGQIRLNPEGTPQVFDFNDWVSGEAFSSFAVAAPGGKAAVTEVIWGVGTEPLIDDPTHNQFTIYAPSDTGDPWIRLQAINSRDPAGYPGAIQNVPDTNATTQTFRPRGCSDLYVYVNGPVMTQPEACEFAGHSLPVIDRHNQPSGSILYGYAWLLSWTGEIKVPAIGKGLFEPDYASREPFCPFLLPDAGRRDQAYDCIKDSELPLAPNFSLSEEQEVDFVYDFNDDLIYSELWTDPDSIATAGLGAATWTAPPGSSEIVVEAWGAGGGGASGYDYREADV